MYFMLHKESKNFIVKRKLHVSFVNFLLLYLVYKFYIRKFNFNEIILSLPFIKIIIYIINILIYLSMCFTYKRALCVNMSKDSRH